jgi:hypothetical protein
MQKQQMVPVLMKKDRLVRFESRGDSVDPVVLVHGRSLFKALALLLALTACSTASSVREASTKVELVQLVGPAELNYPRGDIEVQFGLRITNQSPVAIRLRQIQMTPVGLGGPYQLVNRTYPFNEEVAANSARDVSWWARAIAEGDPNASDANAPVSLRAIALFESPEGHFRKVVMKTFRQ